MSGSSRCSGIPSSVFLLWCSSDIHVFCMKSMWTNKMCLPPCPQSSLWLLFLYFKILLSPLRPEPLGSEAPLFHPCKCFTLQICPDSWLTILKSHKLDSICLISSCFMATAFYQHFPNKVSILQTGFLSLTGWHTCVSPPVGNNRLVIPILGSETLNVQWKKVGERQTECCGHLCSFITNWLYELNELHSHPTVLPGCSHAHTFCLIIQH